MARSGTGGSSPATLRVIPLGGYGEIGRNLTVLECDGKLLIIDAGVAFPDENLARYVDLLAPDLTFLRQRRDDVLALWLTHGHEDHIGAVPYLLADLQPPGSRAWPVYGGALTIGLLRAKLGGRAEQYDLRVVEPSRRVPCGPFDVEPIHINHSIPDAFGLGLRTAAGNIYFSGDFKFDHTPIDGRPTDFAALARLGDEGVRLLISDCTNIRRPGTTPSESIVGETFARLFPLATGRIIVATFASQIHRLQQVFDASERLGKRVLVAGRSMERNAAVARELGHLHYSDEQRLNYSQLAHWPADQTVILITGSQGEPLSGLTRMAAGTHPKLRLHDGDTVIFSATPIPGNETTIYQVINNLMRQGAKVITHGQEQVHVSGHASAEEIKLLVNLLRPRVGVPFHGEYRHMVTYGEMAQDLGLSHEDIYFLQNGDVLRLDENGEALEEGVPHGTWTIEGRRLNEHGLTDQVYADRGFLAESGVISAALAWDFGAGEAVGEPVVTTRGVRGPFGQEADEVLAAAGERVLARLAELDDLERVDPLVVERTAKKALRTYFERSTNSYPVLSFLLLPLNLDQPGLSGQGEDTETLPVVARGEPTALVVDGLVRTPLALAVEDMAALRPESTDDDDTISLPLAVVLDQAGLLPEARRVLGWGAAAEPWTMPLERGVERLHLIFGSDDELLGEADGGPVRLDAPDATVAGLYRLEVVAEDDTTAQT